MSNRGLDPLATHVAGGPVTAGRTDSDREAARRRPPTADERPLRVVCVAGPSDAGKTSLVEALVPELSEDATVATVKSIHHDVDPDEPGTDTHRHREAGAARTVGIAPGYTFSVERTAGGSDATDRRATDRRKREALARTLDRLAADGVDTVLVEGFADVPFPTVRAGVRHVAGPVIGSVDDDPADLADALRALDPVSADAAVGVAEPPTERYPSLVGN